MLALSYAFWIKRKEAPCRIPMERLLSSSSNAAHFITWTLQACNKGDFDLLYLAYFFTKWNKKPHHLFFYLNAAPKSLCSSSNFKLFCMLWTFENFAPLHQPCSILWWLWIQCSTSRLEFGIKITSSISLFQRNHIQLPNLRIVHTMSDF